jgi:hypothetical protein
MQSAYNRAVSLCAACHTETPWAWKKPTMRVMETWLEQREHHIEMKKSDKSTYDHWQHTTLKLPDGKPVTCRGCHVVNKDHTLAKNAPGHNECMQCHNATAKMAFEMNECGRCHKAGSRDEWIVEELTAAGKKPEGKDFRSRPKNDVRACGSAGAKAAGTKANKGWKCFKHETKEHRETKAGEAVQCKQCHWIVENKNQWPKDKYYSNLAELHVYDIIGDPNADRDEQHKMCGGCHPHSTQVNMASAGKNCTFCHAYTTTDNGGYW